MPEDLKDIIPYILSIHGKFYEMTPVAGKSGHYVDESIDYANPFRILKENGYDGYINSEYEGQGFMQDGTRAQMADEREQVRRHHQMMRALIEE